MDHASFFSLPCDASPGLRPAWKRFDVGQGVVRHGGSPACACAAALACAGSDGPRRCQGAASPVSAAMAWSVGHTLRSSRTTRRQLPVSGPGLHPGPVLVVCSMLSCLGSVRLQFRERSVRNRRSPIVAVARADPDGVRRMLVLSLPPFCCLLFAGHFSFFFWHRKSIWSELDPDLWLKNSADPMHRACGSLGLTPRELPLSVTPTRRPSVIDGGAFHILAASPKRGAHRKGEGK